MRIYISVIVLVLFQNLLHSQKEQEMLTVNYITTYNHKHSMDKPYKEFTRLRVMDNRSFFQSYNEMHLDSIRVQDPRNQQALSKYNSHLKFAIEIIEDSLIYNEVLLKDEFQYSEQLYFNWDTSYKDEKQIKGYDCSKATTTYGGRNWTVWYAKEIPVNAGPYKFKGLPGLILEAVDDTNSYHFTLHSVTRFSMPSDIELKRFWHKHSIEDRVITSRSAFNKINHKISNFSKQQRRSSILTDDNGNSTGTFVSYQSGNEPSPEKIRERQQTNSSNDANLIEIAKD